MKLLITGATGFVGRHLTGHLASKSHKISIFARKASGHANEIIGALDSTDDLLSATKGIDIVIHLAAATKGNVYQVNYMGTKNLVEASLQNNVKRFIFVSSYDILTDTDYGISKKMAEDAVINSGISYIIFRPTVIYGPQNNKDINRLISIIRKFPIIPVPANGNFRLQPLHVKDLVNLIGNAIQSEHWNKTYFIAGPEALTFNNIIDIIAGHLSKKPFRVKIPMIFLGQRFTEKICDISAAKQDFSFNPVP